MNSLEKELTCLVFRTNLQSPEDVEEISDVLNAIDGLMDWSVDLEDWEKVLRIEGVDLDTSAIRKLLFEMNVMISEMPMD